MNMFRISLRFWIISMIGFAGLLAIAGIAHADGTNCTATANGFVPLACVPSTLKLGQLYGTTGDLSTFINGLFGFALAVGAILAVLRLVYAGFLYMGQSDMWSRKGEARAIMGNVVLGLLLLLGIWIILNQINPDILTLSALQKITPVQQTQTQTQQNGGATGSF
jgi:hypothetical protein